MSARKAKKRAETPFGRICRSFGLDPKVVSKAWMEQEEMKRQEEADRRFGYIPIRQWAYQRWLLGEPPFAP